MIRYWAEGQGEQTFNLGLKDSTPTHQSEWGIVVSGGVFLAEGNDWRLYPDDTVTVIGQTGNISVVHYNFETTNDSDLPFYQQHSLMLITAAVVAGTVAVSASISFIVRRKK